MGLTAGLKITSKTELIILNTQNKKLIKLICAPLPQGSQMLVARAEATSITRIMIDWAVPLFWPAPITEPSPLGLIRVGEEHNLLTHRNVIREKQAGKQLTAVSIMVIQRTERKQRAGSIV